MKIESKPRNLGSRNKGTLTAQLRALKPGQCLRLSTAAEAYLSGGMSSSFSRTHPHLIVRRQVDGDDVLIWLETRPPKEA